MGPVYSSILYDFACYEMWFVIIFLKYCAAQQTDSDVEVNWLLFNDECLDTRTKKEKKLSKLKKKFSTALRNFNFNNNYITLV